METEDSVLILNASNVVNSLETLKFVCDKALEDSFTVFYIHANDENMDLFRTMLKLLGKGFGVIDRRKLLREGLMIIRDTDLYLGLMVGNKFKRTNLQIVTER